MNLVIVESPAKAKTINKYLGDNYKVLASYGHIRDLPSKNGSVDPEQDFKMEWEVDSFSKKYLKEITDAAKESSKIILATDPDREGEAIAWHVKEYLNEKKLLKDKEIERVVFNEITKKAVIPIIYIKLNYTDYIFIASLCIFLGHVFPIWLKFKGGKGVATYVGVLFSINLTIGFVFVGVWFFTFLISKYSSLSSLLGSLSVPIYLFFFTTQNLVFFSIMFILIIYTHKENIKRLKNKEESKTKIY